MKHTKGEWTYSQQRGKQGHCYAAQVWDDTGDCLATLRATENEEEATANAKLIASAPELLEALIVAEEIIYDLNDRMEILVPDQLETIQSAIKKATE